MAAVAVQRCPLFGTIVTVCHSGTEPVLGSLASVTTSCCPPLSFGFYSSGVRRDEPPIAVGSTVTNS